MSVSRDLKTAKPIKYEEALEECLRYFQGERMQAEIFLDKYAVRNKDNELLESNPDDMHRRLASEFARVDNKKYKNTERKPLSFDEVYESLKNYERVLPAGSPTTTLGNPFMISSASNCFVTATQDSYGGICRTDQEFVQICKRRGGIGTDVSSIRPAGLSVSNAAKTTSGLIPFVRRFSNSIEEVGQNGRRGASMISCSIHHPQVMDFIKSKVEGDISGANISVRLSDEFMNAVDKGTEYQQRWPVDAKPGEEVVSKFINAREIWREINECAHSCGDPGLLLWDNIIKESPADCYSDVGFETISTNPCGELPLSNKDSCRLLCLIVVNYVRNPYTSEAYFDYEAFEKDSRFIQRLADGLIDLEQECVDRIINKIKSDPQDEETKRTEMRIWKDVKETLLNGRRTGTGVTAIGDAIAALGIKYGTDESIEEIGKIYRTLKLGCYRESVEAAKILGPFKAWNFEKEKKNPFLLRIKDEDPKLYKDMKKYGRRNIGLLTTAPTGTISLFASTEFEGKRYFGTASGIENVFEIGYIRRVKLNDSHPDFDPKKVDKNGWCWKEHTVYHPQVRHWMDKTGEEKIEKSPWYKATANDMDWRKKVDLIGRAQKEIDHSISNTINLPKTATVEIIDQIYRRAWKAGCKGLTVYRDGCKEGVLINSSLEEKTRAEKLQERPTSVPCDIYHIKVRGKIFNIAVGIINDKPYEIFAGAELEIDKGAKSGVIKKVNKGDYRISINGDGEVKIKNAEITVEEAALTRIISVGLRNNIDIEPMLHQLEKGKGDFGSFEKALVRVLKKYVKDGTEVKGEQCPECGGTTTLKRIEGCVTCSCGWSKC